MRGSATKIMGFMEGADKRFIIPVYQRKYDWKYEQCRHLSIKQQLIPTINHVYQAFKQYSQSIDLPVDALLADLLKYARYFEKMLTCKSGLSLPKLDACLAEVLAFETELHRELKMMKAE